MINAIINQLSKHYGLNLTPIGGSAIHNPKIVRTIVEIPSYKFCERIDFGKSGSHYAIAIGYNPSSASTNTAMDNTNIKISNFLHSSYDGYFLLNLYPEINSKKIIKTTSIYNKDFYQVIESSLVNYISRSPNSIDLYVFWGRSVYLNTLNLTSLTSGLSNYSCFCVINTNNNLHEHPSHLPQSLIGSKSLLFPLLHKIN